MRLLSMTLSLGMLAACGHQRPTPTTGADDAGRRFARQAYRALVAGKAAPALVLYQQAWREGYRDKTAAYGAACAANRLGDREQAFEWLRRSTDLSWRDAAAFESDSDLQSLRSDPRFTNLLRRARANQEEFDRVDSQVQLPALRKELLAMLEEDQAPRQGHHGAAGQTAEEVTKEKDLAIRMTARLKEIVQQYGWPGKSMVGAKAASAAFILAQHSDQDLGFQRQCLSLVEKSVQAGETGPEDYAYLTDRVLRAEGKPQRYGTQLMRVDGKLVPQPVENPAELDARRRAVGLPPLAEYLEDAAEILGAN